MVYFLIGFMGAGKTAVGKVLAESLSVPFTDSDSRIENRIGMTIAEIFDRYGEAHFRQLEKEFIDGLDNSSAVIACGGGLPCYHSLVDDLLAKGTVIYLRAGVDTLVKRMENERSKRPLLVSGDLAELISSRLGERKACYEKARHVIETDGLSIGETAARILEIVA